MFKKLALSDEYTRAFSEAQYIRSLVLSLIFFFGSLYINAQAVIFTTKNVGNYTTDILLDHLPVVNTDIIFSQGALLLVLFTFFLLFTRPRTAAFTLKTIGLLIITRSIFVSMTHIAPYPDHIVPAMDQYAFVTSGADLFFSGHTAIPYMLALIFWRAPYLRVFYMGCSVIAALAVLLGHLHYTIDVFAAYFITHGVYQIARSWFYKDFKRFEKAW
jgi:PAP2 superfamily C-terminal